MHSIRHPRTRKLAATAPWTSCGFKRHSESYQAHNAIVEVRLLYFSHFTVLLILSFVVTILDKNNS